MKASPKHAFGPLNPISETAIWLLIDRQLLADDGLLNQSFASMKPASLAKR